MQCAVIFLMQCRFNHQVSAIADNIEDKAIEKLNEKFTALQATKTQFG
jgi:hypothetical protein